MPKDDFINISYWSLIKIARENTLKGLKEVSKYAKGNLIDIGCGIKPYEKLFSPYVDSYFGVDYIPTAEGNYGDLTKADYYCDCTDTKLESGSFDTLLSTQVIEHIYDTKKYIAECYRLLKNGGRGIFTIPFVWQCHAEPYDYYRFTKHSIKILFNDQGFSIIELKPLEGAYATIIQNKIVSLYSNLPNDNLFMKVLNRFIRLFIIPILNFKGLHFDKILWNDKLCLAYLLVVEKI